MKGCDIIYGNHMKGDFTMENKTPELNGIVHMSDLRFDFDTWPVERRERALLEMDRYLDKKGDQAAYYMDWKDYGAGVRKGENGTEKRRRIAEDNTAFINALYYFYICCKTEKII